MGVSRPLPSLPITDLAACCAPLAREALSEEGAAHLSEAFRALGDPVRLQLVSLLLTASEGETCACDLVEPVGRSQPTVSHHLKVLRAAGLVTSRRRGTNIVYSADVDQLAALRSVLDPGGALAF